MTDKMVDAAPWGEGDGAENAQTQQQSGPQPQVYDAPDDTREATKERVSSLNSLHSVRAYLARIGAEPTSLRRAVVREQRGRYKADKHVVRFEEDGTVKTESDLEPTEAEQQDIKAEFATVQWPQVLPLKNLTSLDPALQAATREGRLYVIRDRAGMIVMVHERCNEGDRKYQPWTYWDDKVWRRCEPGGLLPLFNAHRLGETETVFIHEGAKAAAHCQRLVDGELRDDKDALKAHPWASALAHCTHVGWIGGAHSPHRTDWSVLKAAGVTKVYIVADNDDEGRSAISEIARRVDLPAIDVQFNSKFAGGFDLADEFPADAPPFEDCCFPATQLTRLVPDGKNKPKAVLTRNAANEWYYLEGAEKFVWRRDTSYRRSVREFNAAMRRYAHVSNVADLLLAEQTKTLESWAYRPVEETIIYDPKPKLNLYQPPRDYGVCRDWQVWLDFMEHLIPDPEERRLVLKFCATLIARPQTRMKFGLLLISKKQGTGKSTLFHAVLKPLIGRVNTAIVDESSLSSSFNGYAAAKRLIIADEIYSGASWKMYHKLKPLITESDVPCNEKFEKETTVENWCHVVASSNAHNALKIDPKDRRWFIPSVAEEPWGKECFDRLYEWLEHGPGLAAIQTWARQYGDYFGPGDQAPATDRKEDIAGESMPLLAQKAREVGEKIAAMSEPRAVSAKRIWEWLVNNSGSRNVAQHEVREQLIEAGLVASEKRYALVSKANKEPVIANEAFWEMQRGTDGTVQIGKLAKEHMVQIGDLDLPSM